MLQEIKKQDNKEDISNKIFLIILASSVLPAVAVCMAVLYVINAFYPNALYEQAVCATCAFPPAHKRHLYLAQAALMP